MPDMKTFLNQMVCELEFDIKRTAFFFHCMNEINYNKEQTHGEDPAGDENGSKSSGCLITIRYKLVFKRTDS